MFVEPVRGEGLVSRGALSGIRKGQDVCLLLICLGSVNIEMWLPACSQTAGIRDVLGKIHRATGLWSDPSLDLEGIVNRWDGGEGVEIDVQAEAKNFIADPHVWGVIIKKGMVFSPEEQKKRVARKGFSKKNGGVIQGV